MYNDQMKRQLKRAGYKPKTQQFETVGDALLAYYLKGGRQSRRIRDVMVKPGYPKLKSGRQLRAA